MNTALLNKFELDKLMEQIDLNKDGLICMR